MPRIETYTSQQRLTTEPTEVQQSVELAGATGKQIAKVGELASDVTMKFMELYKKNDDQRQLDEAIIAAKKQSNQLQLSALQEPDVNNMEERYLDQFRKIGPSISSKIKSKTAQLEFERKWAQDSLTGVFDLQKGILKRKLEIGQIASSLAEEQLDQEYVSAPDATSRSNKLKEIEGYYRNRVALGQMDGSTYATKVKEKKEYLEKLRFDNDVKTYGPDAAIQNINDYNLPTETKKAKLSAAMSLSRANKVTNGITLITQVSSGETNLSDIDLPNADIPLEFKASLMTAMSKEDVMQKETAQEAISIPGAEPSSLGIAFAQLADSQSQEELINSFSEYLKTNDLKNKKDIDAIATVIAWRAKRMPPVKSQEVFQNYVNEQPEFIKEDSYFKSLVQQVAPTQSYYGLKLYVDQINKKVAPEDAFRIARRAIVEKEFPNYASKSANVPDLIIDKNGKANPYSYLRRRGDMVSIPNAPLIFDPESGKVIPNKDYKANNVS